jgi:hypothetical protein
MARVRFDRRKIKSHDLDNELTPAEIADLLKGADEDELPFVIRPLLEAGEAPVGYARQTWGSGDARYYTANRGASSLLVAFCGRGWGLGVPVSAFLQSLRDDLYDVVVLHDKRKQHFDRGVLEFSDSFKDTVQRIKTFADDKNYSRIVTFGASMGGYPALRAGLLLGAERAISIGGRYCWHVGRLLRDGDSAGAFDPLCHCFTGRRTELVAIIGGRNKADTNAVNVLRRTFPQCHVELIATDEHNVLHYFHRASLLRLFSACLFEYWESDVRSGLLALLDRTARYSETAAIERLHQRELDYLRHELDLLHDSRSWRFTRPLRNFAESVRQYLGRFITTHQPGS